MFSYCSFRNSTLTANYSLTILTDGIAAGATLSLLNYFLLGFAVDVDGWYFHSFEIWLACMAVFPVSGTFSFSLLEYRLGYRSLPSAFFENFVWVPFLYVLTHRRLRFDSDITLLVSSSLVACLFTFPRPSSLTSSRTISPGIRPRRKSSVLTFGWKSPKSLSASGCHS